MKNRPTWPWIFKLKLSNSKQSGQVVVEYVLLLIIAVSMATILINLFVSRNQDEPGILVRKWYEMQSEVGKDLPDKCSPTGGVVPCSYP